MNKNVFLALIFSVSPLCAWGAEVSNSQSWTYTTISPDGSYTQSETPATDLTYPKPGQKAESYKDGEFRQGRTLSSNEIGELSKKPHLIISPFKIYVSGQSEAGKQREAEAKKTGGGFVVRPSQSSSSYSSPQQNNPAQQTSNSVNKEKYQAQQMQAVAEDGAPPSSSENIISMTHKTFVHKTGQRHK